MFQSWAAKFDQSHINTTNNNNNDFRDSSYCPWNDIIKKLLLKENTVLYLPVSTSHKIIIIMNTGVLLIVLEITSIEILAVRNPCFIFKPWATKQKSQFYRDSFYDRSESRSSKTTEGASNDPKENKNRTKPILWRRKGRLFFAGMYTSPSTC